MRLEYNYIPEDFVKRMKEEEQPYRFEHYTLEEQEMFRMIGRKNFVTKLEEGRWGNAPGESLGTFLYHRFYRLRPEYILPEKLTVRHFLKTNTHAFVTLPEDAKEYLKKAGLRNCLALAPNNNVAKWEDCGLLSTDEFNGNWTYRLKETDVPVPDKPFVEYDVFESDEKYYIRMPSGNLMLHKVFTQVGFMGFKFKDPFTGEEQAEWASTFLVCLNKETSETLPMIPVKVLFLKSKKC